MRLLLATSYFFSRHPFTFLSIPFCVIFWQPCTFSHDILALFLSTPLCTSSWQLCTFSHGILAHFLSTPFCTSLGNRVLFLMAFLAPILSIPLCTSSWQPCTFFSWHTCTFPIDTLCTISWQPCPFSHGILAFFLAIPFLVSLIIPLTALVCFFSHHLCTSPSGTLHFSSPQLPPGPHRYCSHSPFKVFVCIHCAGSRRESGGSSEPADIRKHVSRCVVLPFWVK